VLDPVLDPAASPDPRLLTSSDSPALLFTVDDPRLLPIAPFTNTFIRERSESPLKGWFDWVKPFIKEDDIHVLNRSSLDAYLFLRYLKVLSFICFVGCCLMWPILMPIHATGGKGLSELDSLTMGNVTSKNILYVHVAVAWIFFGAAFRDDGYLLGTRLLTGHRFHPLHHISRVHLLHQPPPRISLLAILLQALVSAYCTFPMRSSQVP